MADPLLAVAAAAPAAGAIPLSPLDLAIAGALVLVAGAVSVALKLGLGARLAIASLRTVAQLVLIGYVLRWIFAIDSAPALLGVLGVMLLVAGRAAVDRAERTFRGVYLRGLASMAASAALTTFTVTAAVIGVTPWYDPQYVIPLAGMVLGNTLTGISLCLDTLLEGLTDRSAQVEAALALGATRWEAAREPVADAVRRGMVPIINSMTVVGVVSLPGMMTGQILAGAEPLEAVKYQIVVMFMLAGSTALGSIAMALLVYRRLFNDRHQLRRELVTRR